VATHRDGRALHLDLLREDVAPVVPNSDLAAAYGQFLAYNEQFKELCGAWQIFKFNGELNDHSDAGYDAAVLENLAISTPRRKCRSPRWATCSSGWRRTVRASNRCSSGFRTANRICSPV
jgi:hypothetical protein